MNCFANVFLWVSCRFSKLFSKLGKFINTKIVHSRWGADEDRKLLNLKHFYRRKVSLWINFWFCKQEEVLPKSNLEQKLNLKKERSRVKKPVSFIVIKLYDVVFDFLRLKRYHSRNCNPTKHLWWSIFTKLFSQESFITEAW